MNCLRHACAGALALGLTATGLWAQEEGQDAQPAAEVAPEAPSDPNSWLDGWDGSAALGLDGSTGNSETLNFRGNLDAVRDTADQTTSFDITYLLKRDDGDNTDNRLDALLRNDWKFGESPWRAWATARYEYDQFKDWDSRVSLFVGPGYVFVDDGETFFMGRAGAGLVREFGSDNNEWQPEGLLGVDYERQLTERQKLTATAEYYPSLKYAHDYRLIGRAAWKLLVDPEINMSLEAGVEDEYDSTPSGDDKRNDFRYYVLLAWSFGESLPPAPPRIPVPPAPPAQAAAAGADRVRLRPGAQPADTTGVTAKQLLGGLGGGLLGAAIWVAVVLCFGYEARAAPWALGAMVGLGVLAAGVDGHCARRGVHAALVALIASLGARMAIASIDAKGQAGRLRQGSDEPLICDIAEAIQFELGASGRQARLAGDDAPHTRADFPDGIWAEATRRWGALTEPQRQGRRDRAIARRRQTERALVATAFVGGLGALDVLWLVLGAGSAFKLASGTGPSAQMRGGLDLEAEPAGLTGSNVPSAGPASSDGPSMRSGDRAA